MLCQLICGSCGHQADLDRFTRTPVYGEPPKNVYQCPACAKAIERRSAAPTLLPSGYLMPGKVGKWNHAAAAAKAIDWNKFAFEAVALLDSLGANYYIKDDLRAHLPQAA